MAIKVTEKDLLAMKHYDVILLIYEYLHHLPSDELRKEFISNLDVCVYCGSTDLPCHCMNDE